MIGVCIEGIHEDPPPIHEARRLGGIENRLRFGGLPRCARGLRHFRRERLAAIDFPRQMINAPQQPEDQPLDAAIHNRMRGDAQLPQTIVETIEPFGAAWMEQLRQAVDALAAVAEIATGGPFLKPQIHLRAEGEIVVHAVDDLGQRMMLAGQAQEGNRNAFEVIEMHDIERPMLAQEVGEQRVHFRRTSRHPGRTLPDQD